MEKLMNLTPREKDKPVIALAALVARTVDVMSYAIDPESAARLWSLGEQLLRPEDACFLSSPKHGLAGLERKAR
jgi:hypothetical protein